MKFVVCEKVVRQAGEYFVKVRETSATEEVGGNPEP
jgi:hypothetical protein